MKEQYEKAIEGLVYTETTRDIRVSVQPEFLAEQSDPGARIYSFAYTVLIENLGLSRVQLLSRHWVIKSAGMLYNEVKGDGVVGEQPTLESGEAYEYSSGSMIADAYGSMHGTYLFENELGERFEVLIPEFDLISKITLH